MAVHIPDSRIHEYCHKCKQWFEPEDGAFQIVSFGGPVDKLRRFGDKCMGKSRNQRFMCFECVEKRKKQKKTIAVIVILLAILFMAACLGFLFFYAERFL